MDWTTNTQNIAKFRASFRHLTSEVAPVQRLPNAVASFARRLPKKTACQTRPPYLVERHARRKRTEDRVRFDDEGPLRGITGAYGAHVEAPTAAESGTRRGFEADIGAIAISLLGLHSALALVCTVFSMMQGRGGMSQPLNGGALQLSKILRRNSCCQAGLFNAVHAARESM